MPLTRDRALDLYRYDAPYWEQRCIFLATYLILEAGCVAVYSMKWYICFFNFLIVSVDFSNDIDPMGSSIVKSIARA